jgi:hypothetical protein
MQIKVWANQEKRHGDLFPEVRTPQESYVSVEGLGHTWAGSLSTLFLGFLLLIPFLAEVNRNLHKLPVAHHKLGSSPGNTLSSRGWILKSNKCHKDLLLWTQVLKNEFCSLFFNLSIPQPNSLFLLKSLQSRVGNAQGGCGNMYFVVGISSFNLEGWGGLYTQPQKTSR